LTRYLSESMAHCYDNDVMYMVFKGEEWVIYGFFNFITQ
jgi:hypothetical protein